MSDERDSLVLVVERAVLRLAVGTVPSGASAAAQIAAHVADPADPHAAAGYVTAAEVAAAYQPLGSDLTALEALAAPGIAVRTAANTWALRSVAAGTEGLVVVNPLGTAGNIAIGLANDMAAIEALASTGLAVRIGTDLWAQRVIAVSGEGLSITNPAGIVGNPTLALADDAAALEALTGTGFAKRTGVNTWSLTTPTAAEIDAGLASLASVDTGADLLPYTTGANAWSSSILSAFARQLLDDADGAAMRTTLGLVIGTNVQAWDADLDLLSALGTGIPVKTSATPTWASRSIVGTSPISVTNGAGVTGNPTVAIDLTIETLFYQHLVLAADQSDSTGTNVDLTGMAFTPTAGGYYLVEVFGFYSTAATTTGLRWQVAPGANVVGTSWHLAPASASAQVLRIGPAGTNVVGSGSATTANEPFYGWAILLAASSPGACKLQFATEVGASQVTVKAGTTMRYRRMA